MPDDEDHAFDPIALTLAVWLGLIVSVSSLSRLAQDATARHDAEAAAHPRGTALTQPLPSPHLLDPGAYS